VIVFCLSDRWARTYPGAFIGVLALRGVVNPERNAELDQRKTELEASLRSQYASWDRATLRALPRMQPYTSYYRRFQKTYHLQLQLESVVFKNQPLARGAALVEAMFMAELKSLLLTAGHDLDLVRGKVGVDVAVGGETYLTVGGEERTLKPADMFIYDEEGILSSILYGPDRRTRLTPATRRVLFTVYALPGIRTEDLLNHLHDLLENVRIVTPQAEVEELETYGAV
jgi:DNA/RNA-binding domain of Phe-tRNA-synthetase-like protein